ncbi:MAG: hypothetical protein HOV68_28170 [Streptomycetaceae bacterium]|nr:hypothetical protein [Streptomycetaceae bacterium]
MMTGTHGPYPPHTPHTSQRRVVVAGFLAALLLVLAFGNQWLWEDLIKKGERLDPNSSSHFLAWLNTPHWVVDTSGVFAGFAGQDVAAGLFGVAALLVAVAAVLGSAVRRAGFNPFISGWFALVVGGAAYGLTGYLIAGGVTGSPTTSMLPSDDTERTLAATLDALAAGGGYGLLAGWFVGIVCTFVAAGGGVRTLIQAPSAVPPQAPGYPPQPPVYPPPPGSRPY